MNAHSCSFLDKFNQIGYSTYARILGTYDCLIHMMRMSCDMNVKNKKKSYLWDWTTACSDIYLTRSQASPKVHFSIFFRLEHCNFNVELKSNHGIEE